MNDIELLVKKITDITIKKQALEEQEKETKQELKQLMEKQDINLLENARVTVKYMNPFQKYLIDRDKLKNLFPTVEKECTKVVQVESFIRVSVK